MTFTTSRVFLLILSLGLALSTGLAFVEAQDDDQPRINYRQRLMKGQGASMASVADILKFKMPFSTEHLVIHAGNISGYAKLIPGAFEKNITAGPTDAKAAIWENWDDFVAKSEALVEASAKLAEAAEAAGEMAAMMPHVKAVGDACSACHNEYRKPEEESYMRQ